MLVVMYEGCLVCFMLVGLHCEVAGVFHVLVACMRWLVCFMCWLHV